MFSPRYSRNVIMLGKKGQEKIKESKVAVFGLGGLGNFVAAELALAGVGTLVLVDRDSVEEENLNRQFLYRKEDVGKAKADVAAERLREINPDVEVFTFCGDVKDVPDGLLEGCSVFVDCLDNWEGRREVFRRAEELKVPVVHGAAERWKGQVGFLRTFGAFERFTSAGCVGIVAPTVGVIASMQAALVLRYLTGEEVEEFIMHVDLEKMETFKVRL